ncbi:MAG: hypothetical protein KGL03_13330, partial [Nitrospirota bacterium]|nr:hypothetical protein [Nitrospirota bacterium]
LGAPLSVQLVATDPDIAISHQPSALRFSAVGLPEGATFDTVTGRFDWTPGPAQAGDYLMFFTVSDGALTETQPMLIRASATPEAPKAVIELTPSFPVVPGQRVLLHAIATSLADIVSLTVTVDGQPVTVEQVGAGGASAGPPSAGNVRVQLTASTPGKHIIEATATDADGLVGRTTTVLKVRDAADADAPVVAFDPTLNRSQITGLTDLIASVGDANLDNWRLELAPLGSHEFTKLAGGDAVGDGALASLDPAALSNGFYWVRLTATDISGRTSQTEILVEVNSVAKSAQYLRSETDLTVDLGGIPVSIARQYDSLNSTFNIEHSTFGSGWRLANREFGIQTDAGSGGLEVGSRLYLTLPDGNRVGFTFAPERYEIPGLVFYTPAFVADPQAGGYTLSALDANLTLVGSKLYDLRTGQPYNPSNSAFSVQHFRMPIPSRRRTAPGMCSMAWGGPSRKCGQAAPRSSGRTAA